MELNGRMLSILEEIVSSETLEIPAKRIRDMGNSKKRTFYYDFKKINNLLHDLGIEEIQLEKGICRISEEGKAQIAKVISEDNIEYYKSSSERRIISSIYIGLSSEKQTLPALEKYFDVSKNTILSDLRLIRKELAGYDIELVYDAYSGYRYIGEESAVRRYLLNQFRRIAADRTKREIRDLVNRELSLNEKRIDIWTAFRECLTIYEEVLGTDIADADIDACVFVMSVSYIRSGRGFRYKVKRRYSAVRDIPPFESGRIMMKRIEEYMGLKAYASETVYIVLFLLSTKNISINESGHDGLKAKEFTERYINCVEEEGHVKFHDKDNLKKRMANHIMPMMYRIEYNMQIENPHTESVKINYPEMFDLARKAFELTDPKLASEVSDDELSYLAIYIASGTGKRNENSRKKKILIVCAEGVATALMIQSQLEDILGDYYEYEISSIRRAEYADFKDYLLVVTTLDADHLHDKALKVSVLLSNENEQNILELLSREEFRAEFPLNEMMKIIGGQAGISQEESKDINKELLKYLNAHRTGV